MTSETGTIHVTGDAIRKQAEAILLGWGMDQEDSSLTAEALLDCDLRGIDTHGISLLALYAKWIKAGHFNLAAKFVVENEGPAFASINAGGALGFAVSVKAMDMAVAKARDVGVAAVTVYNSHHFGAAGYYARRAAKQGMLSLVATSTKVVCVVPPGAASPVLGTNPLAYGIPRDGAEPVVFDMATSTAAGNKIRMYDLRSEPVPEGWVVDGEGQMVTDPKIASKLVYEPGDGGLTPLGALPHLGSHKGYGLGLLVHFLGGALSGGTFAGSPNSGEGKPEGDNIGHFFLAIDPNAFRSAKDFFADIEDVAGTLKSTKPVDPNRPVLLPGDIEEALRARRLQDGIPLTRTLVAQINEITDALNVPFHLNPAV